MSAGFVRDRRAGLALAVIALLAPLAGCGADEAGVTAESYGSLSSPTPGTDGNELIADTDVPSGGFDDGFPLDADKPTRDYDRFLVDAIDDIQQFWRDNYKTAYANDGSYPDLLGGVHPAYPERTSGLPSGCEFTGDYADVEDNAFYCDEGDFIVYDDSGLFPQFADEFGPVTVAVIMAHEWGHAIQSSHRHDVLYSFVSTTLELQADCFAGAWVGHVRSEGLNGYSISQSDITGALLGLVQIGDAPGGSAYDPLAHGSAFDRVSAFQDGFTGGLTPCVDYETNEPQPLQFGFTAEELSRPNPGDFPFGDEMFVSMRDDLKVFWDAVVSDDANFTPPELTLVDSAEPQCPDGSGSNVVRGVLWCRDANEVVISLPVARDFYDLVPGDFSVAYLIGLGYAEAVQDAIDTGLDSADRALLDDCMVGMWSSDILPFNTQPVVPDTETTPRIVLSPGDLDEAIRTALLLGDAAGDRRFGTPFEKVDAFRQGVLFGRDGCFGG